MSNFKDLTGQKFSRLLVLSRYLPNEKGHALFLCKCDCGKEKVIAARHLKGKTKSCGCYNNEAADLTDNTYGNLTVLKFSRRDQRRRQWYICLCGCGKEKELPSMDFKLGKIISCGCIKAQKFRERVTKHNESHTLLYYVWQGMLRRCDDEKNPGYKNYGGRGISVCDEWKEYPTFAKWARSKGYKKPLTIERLDNDGNYNPGNCKWATSQEQGFNKRNTVKIEIEGHTYNSKEFYTTYGIKPDVLYYRLKKGLNVLTGKP